MNLEFPDAETLRDATGYSVEDLPRFAVAHRKRGGQGSDGPTTEPIDDVAAATRDAVGAINGFDSLPDGSTVAITAGSRGIHGISTILAAAAEELRQRGLEPFLVPAMGSHGGATAEGQRETLESLGITPDTVGCEIRASMAVEAVGDDDLGRPVYAGREALDADAILLANRVKPHTDFRGAVESGLAKMAVAGLGKDRGAASFHDAALAGDAAAVIRDRLDVLLAETPIVGGVAVVEDADHRTARIEGVDAAAIPEREPELLEIARANLPTLPVDDLDLLVVDEMGKDVSGTGMDTNVLGRYDFHGQVEPESPDVSRVYARSLTDASHGNAVGMGLADVVHRDLVRAVDFADTYVNVVTSGEPRRAKVPVVVPDDATALLLGCASSGVTDPAESRVARIRNTMEPGSLVVSEPVAAELRKRADVTVGPLEPLSLADGQFSADPY